MQRELQKQISAITKETVKANNDAMWARFQEENAKQATDVINNFLNKDFSVMLEKMVKKEIAAVVPGVIRAITPVIEKTIPLAVSDCFQVSI